MRRRELIIDVVVAAILWPYTVRAQQKSLPVIGFLSSRSPEDSSAQMTGFRQGLAELGYVEGENLAIEYRWARGDYERLPAFGRQAGARPRDRGRRTLGFGGKGGYLDNPDRLFRGGSCAGRPCRELQPARGEHHGHRYHVGGARSQAARPAA